MKPSIEKSHSSVKRVSNLNADFDLVVSETRTAHAECVVIGSFVVTLTGVCVSV